MAVNIKRYRFRVTGSQAAHAQEMVSQNGEWVKYDDHLQIVERLRAALQLIASQGPNFGPDGTLHTWEHWSVIARKALEDNRMELDNEH